MVIHLQQKYYIIRFLLLMTDIVEKATFIGEILYIGNVYISYHYF